MESSNQNFSLKSFVKNYFVDVFHFDKRLFKTLSSLLFKPGTLSNHYFQDKTDSFVPPLKLYFIINFVFFLLTPLINSSDIQIFNFNLESLTGSNQTYQRLVENQIEKTHLDKTIYTERFNAHLKYNQPAFVFLIIPVFALFVSLVNFRTKKVFIQHLIYSTHYLSFVLLFLLISSTFCAGLDLIFSTSHVISDIVGQIFIFSFLIFTPLYLAISTKQFYKSNWIFSLFKAILLFAAFIFALALYVKFMFFNTILALILGY